jgi:hypothetical protein
VLIDELLIVDKGGVGQSGSLRSGDVVLSLLCEPIEGASR